MSEWTPKPSWCSCGRKPKPGPAEEIYMMDNSCKCGIGKHHYHCPDCGGITQIG